MYVFAFVNDYITLSNPLATWHTRTAMHLLQKSRFPIYYAPIFGFSAISCACDLAANDNDSYTCSIYSYNAQKHRGVITSV